MSIFLRSVLIIVLLALGAAEARCAGAEIALRQAARVAPDAPLTLGDIADLRGEEALAHAGVVLVTRARDAAARTGWYEVRLDEVREALEREGVNWGRLSLTGSTCIVRVSRPPEISETNAAPTTVTGRDRAKRTPVGVDLGDGATVRAYAQRALMRLYGVEASDLRVAFDPSDDALLDTRVWGRRIDVQPGGSSGSSRIMLNVWVYEGERIAASGVIRADVEVRRDVIVTTAALRRGDAIASEVLRQERLWMSPGGAAFITSLDDAAGAHARTRVGVGTALRTDHIETPIVVRRNELVTVHCVSGGIVIRTPARAQGDARVGDVIEFRIDRTRRPFLARVGGPGIAVMLADHEHQDDQTGDDR
ncbi:MAG: flagella basal body P-ring formation protein FlgA [Phycisphaerales bacterium]|nr:MAG: flagella basal body P-ring formation protein FlgA [Phycisphaerales bacterium]